MGITLNQLTNSISKVATKLREEFTHSNINVLDKLSTSNNGYLLYDDKQVAGSGVLLRDETVLYEGNANSGSIALSDSVENYDYLEIRCSQFYNNIHNFKNNFVIPTKEIEYNVNNLFSTALDGISTTYKICPVTISFTDKYTMSIGANADGWLGITSIVGIRYKQTQNTTVLWEGNQYETGTIDLYDNYTNYEHLALIIGNGTWDDGGLTSIWFVNENKSHIASIEQGGSCHITYYLKRTDNAKQISLFNIVSSSANGASYWNAQDCPLVKIIGIRATLPTDKEVVTDAQVLSEIEATINLLNTEEGE